MMRLHDMGTKARRLFAIGLRDPVEFVDRVLIAIQGRSEVESLIESDAPPRSAGSVAPQLLQSLAARLSLRPDDVVDPEDVASGWAALQSEWEDLWATIDYRAGHDADPALVRTVWLCCRILRPNVVVETGVGRGVSTFAILDALERNGRGRLISIDLPPLADPWHRASAELVPQGLRHRWEYRRGSVHRVLPATLRALAAEGDDVAVHVADSLHTAAHIEWEVSLARASLAAGGVIIVDDVGTWVDAHLAVDGRTVFAHEAKDGHFAFLRP
jgi:hypothetical protein